MLADPEIRGVIITVPNEQHLPVAREDRQGRQARLYREADRRDARGRDRDRGAGRAIRRHRHRRSQRALARRVFARIRRGDRCRRTRPRRLHRGEFLQRARARTHPQHLALVQEPSAPGGPLSQLAIHQFDILHYLGGDIVEASSMASKLSPVGAEVDDQSMTTLQLCRRQARLCRLLLDVARHLLRARVRLQGPDALARSISPLGTRQASCICHPTLYIQRGKDGYGKREDLKVPESDMFRRRAGNVRRKLPDRQAERTDRAQRQCRGRGGERRAALDRQ